MIYQNIQDFAKSLKNRRILALDIGAARIGTAFSDESGMIASAYEVYERKNTNRDTGYIARIARDEKASGIVMGLPLEMDGSENVACERVRTLAAKIFTKTNLPIFLQDERMSTKAVTWALMESDMTRKNRQAVDDKLAACYILQGVLDIMRNIK